MSTTIERRAKPRVSLSEKVVLYRGRERFEGESLDISASGLASVCPMQGRRGERVRLELSLLNAEVVLPIAGLLIRQAERAGGVLWAIRFELLEPRVAASIELYVREQLKLTVRLRSETETAASSAKRQATRPSRAQAMIDRARGSLSFGDDPFAERSGQRPEEKTTRRLRSLYKKAVESLDKERRDAGKK